MGKHPNRFCTHFVLNIGSPLLDLNSDLSWQPKVTKTKEVPPTLPPYTKQGQELTVEIGLDFLHCLQTELKWAIFKPTTDQDLPPGRNK